LTAAMLAMNLLCVILVCKWLCCWVKALTCLVKACQSSYISTIDCIWEK